jgi:hypothetical protein
MERSDSRRKIQSTKTARRTAKRPVVTAAPMNGTSVSPEERHQMIAEAAYYRAEQRGFLGGDPLQDWIEAEAEVASKLHVDLPASREAHVMNGDATAR